MDDYIISCYLDEENYCMSQLCNFNVNKIVEKVEVEEVPNPFTKKSTRLVHIFMRSRNIEIFDN